MNNITEILRLVCNSLKIPVVVILLVLAAVTVILAGSVVAELFIERRHLKVCMPKLVDSIFEKDCDIQECIKNSGLLKNQKEVLIEITNHKDIPDQAREALALRLLTQERGRYDLLVKLSDLVIKLGPALGLLGTLIPLGPGIIALGKGDVLLLSQSLLTAFDTTITGLSCAAVATVISTIRKRWYTEYMSILETLTEAVLEAEKNEQ